MTSVFAGDEVLTAAILDRLLHHDSLINFRGQFYRIKDKLKSGSPIPSTNPNG